LKIFQHIFWGIEMDQVFQFSASLLAFISLSTAVLAQCPFPLPNKPSPTELRACFDEIAELRKTTDGIIKQLQTTPKVQLTAIRFDRDGPLDGKRTERPFTNDAAVQEVDVFIPGSEEQDWCSVSGILSHRSATLSPICIVQRRNPTVGPGWKVTFRGAVCEVSCLRLQMVK
jgi:hypothetical protein